MATGISVLVVDDHKIFRLGMVSTLKSLPGIKDIYEAENGMKAVETVRAHPVDLIFMDIRMPVMNGIEATSLIKKENQKTKVIALSMFDDQEFLSEMFANGASGYLLKNTDVDEISEAIQTVMQDEHYFSRDITEAMLNNLLDKQRAPKQHDGTFTLTNREKEILPLICGGLSNKEIGNQLQISSRTVEGHRARLLYKTQCKNTAGLISYAIRHNIK